MNSLKTTAVAAIAGLLLTTTIPLVSPFDSGAAHAKSEKSEGGGGGKGSEKSADKGGGKSDAKSKATKSSKSSKSAATKSKKSATKAKAKSEVVAKGKPVAEEGVLHPRDLGKMNGALNANINAVLAHIRNGQTTQGPVGLLAGLAIADAAGATAMAEAEAMQKLADDIAAVDAAMVDAGFVDEAGLPDLEAYLLAKEDGTATPEQIATIDGLIEAAGGLDDTGTALAETAPTAEEIAEAIAAAEAVVGDAEAAIAAALNKDTDMVLLLAALRDKLAPHQEAITAAIGGTESTDDVPEVVIITE